jgi:nicotinamidase-related amidase
MITYEFWRERRSGEILAIELTDGRVTGCSPPLDAEELEANLVRALVDHEAARAESVERTREAFELYDPVAPYEPRAPRTALLVVDMLRDFVDGALANPRAQRILEPLARLLEHARASGWVVVFSNDAHEPGDPELRVWGEHAMAGSEGARVIEALAPQPGGRELVSPKRVYGAFDCTGLGRRLRALGVQEVVLCGQHTHICVRHSAYGALVRGFAIAVPRDAVCAFEGVDEEEALAYLHDVYGARITTVDELRTAETHAAAAAQR